MLTSYSEVTQMTTLAFGESLAILGMLGILAVCAAVIGYAVYHWARYKKLGPCLITCAALATLPPSALVTMRLIQGNIEYNPWIESTDQLFGVYSNGDRILKLHCDGTYSSSGIKEITSGKWSHYDWNLTLTNTQLETPRIITRNGVLCVAPFYDGPDGPDGILLIKQDASDGDKTGE